MRLAWCYHTSGCYKFMNDSFLHFKKLNLQTEYKRRHPRHACNSELYAEISESSNIKEKVIEISKLLFNCFNLLFYIILIRGISQKRFTNIFTLKLDIIVQFYPILRNTIDNITCSYVSLMVSYFNKSLLSQNHLIYIHLQ